MQLSEDTLYHFTNETGFLGILKSKLFWPQYNLETFSSEYTQDHQYAIPMVCFCDLNFPLTEYHQKKYGPFAIGLKKSWGIKRKLNPVSYQLSRSAYTDANEDLYQLLSMLIEDPIEDLKKDNNSLSQCTLNSQIKCREITYMINRFLLIIHSNKKAYCYYDEREWRYIPDMLPKFLNDYEKKKDDKSYRQALSKGEYQNDALLESAQKHINSNYSLSFNETDINYLITANEETKTEAKGRLINHYSQDFLNEKLKTYSELTTLDFATRPR